MQIQRIGGDLSLQAITTSLPVSLAARQYIHYLQLKCRHTHIQFVYGTRKGQWEAHKVHLQRRMALLSLLSRMVQLLRLHGIIQPQRLLITEWAIPQVLQSFLAAANSTTICRPIWAFICGNVQLRPAHTRQIPSTSHFCQTRYCGYSLLLCCLQPSVIINNADRIMWIYFRWIVSGF